MRAWSKSALESILTLHAFTPLPTPLFTPRKQLDAESVRPGKPREVVLIEPAGYPIALPVSRFIWKIGSVLSVECVWISNLRDKKQESWIKAPFFAIWEISIWQMNLRRNFVRYCARNGTTRVKRYAIDRTFCYDIAGEERSNNRIRFHR